MPGRKQTRRAIDPVLSSRLDWEKSQEHTEHDGADKGEGDIRGNNAQPADDEVYGNAPLVYVVPAINVKASKAFPAKKVSVPVPPDLSTIGTGAHRG